MSVGYRITAILSREVRAPCEPKETSVSRSFEWRHGYTPARSTLKIDP